MFGVGYQELVVIFLIVLIFYGGKKIPEIARGMGKGLREFKKAKDGLADSIDEIDNQVSSESSLPPTKKTAKENTEDGGKKDI